MRDNHGTVVRGYDAKQFHDICKRYLPSPPPEKSATPLQNTETPMNTGLSGVADTNACSATENLSATDNTLGNNECSAVADVSDIFEHDPFDPD